MQTKNFYLFTGKGGVGKTTLSVAFSKYLQNQGIDVIHFSLKNHSLDNKSFESSEAAQLCQTIGVKHMNLDLNNSAIEYMGKKLGSQTVASWIAKAPFFRALINMIPGFNYLIYLGKIFEMIKSSQDKLVCVLDSPSSGHAITMLESIQNFRDIFQSGLVFDDTNKMLNLFLEEGFSQINIISLPTQMSIHEAIELKSQLESVGAVKSKIFSNYGLSVFKEDILKDGPEFLKNKLIQEQEILDNYKDAIDGHIAQSTSQDKGQLFAEIVPLMKNLV